MFLRALVFQFGISLVLSLGLATTSVLAQTSSPTIDCATLEASIKSKLETNPPCEKDAECASVDLGCPFGCESIVPSSIVPELNSLNHAYTANCSRCMYDCQMAPGSVRCLNKKCVKISPMMIEAELGPLNPSDCKAEEKRISRESHKARACKESSDCISSPLGCPYGCNGIVNKAEFARMSALYSRLQKTCKTCVYKCAAPSGTPFCLHDHCVWKE